MAKSKHIVQIAITGLFLCAITIASKTYENASETETHTIVKTASNVSQKIILPDDYDKFSFYMPAANPITNTTDNTTSDDDTEQADTETDTAESSAIDTADTTNTTAETTPSDTSHSTDVNESTTPPEPAATSGICEKDGYVDDHWISDINAQLAMIPSNLITEFQNDGWHIYCTDMDIDAVYYNSQFGAVMGTTNYEEHRILIEDRTIAVTDAVVHEMGHWLDWHNGTVTDSNEFMNIYYAETDIFKSTFNMTCYYDQKELFAEAFWKYLTNNQQLANSCPQLYTFMSRYV